MSKRARTTRPSVYLLRNRRNLYKSRQVDLVCNDIPGRGPPYHRLYAAGWKMRNAREAPLHRLEVFTICFIKSCET